MTSGVVINDEGHIICCRHGILKPDGSLCDLVSVESQDQQHTICDVLGSEPTLNFAVLRLAVFNEKLPPNCVPAKLGNSSTVRPGLWAIGVGDPDGPEMFYGVGTFTSIPGSRVLPRAADGDLHAGRDQSARKGLWWAAAEHSR